jgi:hypothetical protein
LNFFKRKKTGPFEANRILDTNESKIDQVFTKGDEKPVALFVHVTEDEAKKIGVEGYVGPTNIGGKGDYERNQKWVTRAIYWPNNIPGAQFIANMSTQIIDAVKTGYGTIIPGSVQFKEIQKETIIPISGSSTLVTDKNGQVELKGIFFVQKSG